jgi:uncharacterized membrane protein
MAPAECTIQVRMDRAVTALRRALASASVVWAVSLPLAPFAVSHVPHSAVAWLGAAVYVLGSVVCHQLPARSFHLWSLQLPVCARCTGIYVGAAATALALVARAQRSSAAADTTEGPRPMAVAVVAALPTIATLAFEWIAGTMPANWIRALAGLPLGAALAWLAIRVN